MKRKRAPGGGGLGPERTITQADIYALDLIMTRRVSIYLTGVIMLIQSRPCIAVVDVMV